MKPLLVVLFMMMMNVASYGGASYEGGPPVDRGGRAAPGADAATGSVTKQGIVRRKGSSGRSILPGSDTVDLGPTPEEIERDRIDPMDVLDLTRKIVDKYRNSEEAKNFKKAQDAMWEKQRKLCLAGLSSKRHCEEVVEHELINRMLEDMGEDR